MEQYMFFEDFEPMTKLEAKQLNPQVLAFVGDGVHTLYVRTIVAKNVTAKSNDLHNITRDYVKASGQSDVVEVMLPTLTQDELDIYKRARNYKTKLKAKNANTIDYRRATGYEALVGYLYLINDHKRLLKILSLSLKGKDISEDRR